MSATVTVMVTTSVMVPSDAYMRVQMREIQLMENSYLNVQFILSHIFSIQYPRRGNHSSGLINVEVVAGNSEAKLNGGICP